MKIQPIITIWEREVIRYWRDKTRIISTTIQPLMFLAIFGLGLRNTLAQGNFSVDYVQFMYPGIIAMSIMGVTFFSTVSTVWDREFGFLKEILVAPVPRLSIVIGKALGATTIAASQALILLLLTPFIGISVHISILPLLLLFMILLALAVAGLGLLIASLMKSTESFGLLMQVLVFPMFFLSGAFFPLTAVPFWMAVLSRLNPLTYAVDAFRQLLLGAQAQQALVKIVLFPVMVDGMILLMLAGGLLIAASVLFNREG